MLIRVLAIGVLFVADSVFAQAPPQYLVLADQPTAAARSQSQCTAVGCDGTLTKYWWSVQPLTDGTAAVVIQPATVYDVKPPSGIGKCATCGLTVQEQAVLKTQAQVAPLLPAPAPIGTAAAVGVIVK
jgi:hypothetical protein